LAEQDNLYVLMVNEPEQPRPEVISSLSAVHPSDDHESWLRYLASPEVVIVTSTVTEAGYRRNASGGLDLDDAEVAADIAALQSDLLASVSTAPGRFVAGLLARRAAGAGPLTFLPCDNVPDNGEMAHRVITDFARAVDPTLADWMAEHTTFVTTMVDRITPRATDADRADLVARTGIDDPSLVVTEPYLEWVLAGRFIAGRPAWEQAGATFVDDTTPFETRKLWLLNGSHSLMAYAASIRGHETVAEAIADPVVRDWVLQWWDDAQRQLSLPEEHITAYRAALLDRYANPRIRHLLAQIAADGSQKVPIRIVPALRAEVAAGRTPTGALRAVAAWVLHLRGEGAPVTDGAVADLQQQVADDLPSAVAAVLAWLGLTDLHLDEPVLALAHELSATP
jgi:fructuronate reductase